MGRFFITPCFADETQESFVPGPMRIVNGKQTDFPIRRQIRIQKDQIEGIDWYRKPDPDFKKGTYTRCHKALRKTLHIGDVLFFRTLWRDAPYLIGYFEITDKTEDSENPLCVTDVTHSKCVDFLIPITKGMVLVANKKARFGKRHFNMVVNENLGRSYMELSSGIGNFYKHYIDLIHSAVSGKSAR